MMVDPNLLELIEKYGIPTVLLVIISVTVVPWAAEQVEKIIDAFIADRKPAKKKLVLRFDDHAYINDKLSEALKTLGAETAGVIQFHNGGENISGLSFERMSVTHAQSANEYPFRNFQGVHISFVVDIFKDLSSKRFVCVDRKLEDTATRRLLVGGDLGCACIHAIHDDSHMVGALIVAFKDENCIGEEVRANVGRLAAEIGVRLDRMRRDAE